MKAFWYRLPLALKFALPIALLCLLSSLLVIGAAQWAQQQLIHTRVDGLGYALAGRLAASAARPLIDNDAVHLQAVVADFAADPNIDRAAIFDIRQQLASAAGNEASDSHEYSASIHWQDGVIGRVALTLKTPAAKANALSSLRLSDLLTLAAVLAVAVGAWGLWLGRRLESLLLLLTRRLSGEVLVVDYPDCDTLGHLLHHPVPPLLAAEPAAPVRKGATLLQVYCPSEVAVDCERALHQVRAVSQLYQGEVSITRAAGMTIRFAAEDELEGPFRALCCAQLLRRLSAPHALRLALAPLASCDDGVAWREQHLIRQLNQACVEVAKDDDIVLDGQLQRHPTISERCELEAREEFWIVKALKPPYCTLLERQFTTLQAQLEIQPETAALSTEAMA